MKISVITPSFNQGRFIERCLASVRDQRGDFSVEHIILDNCSTDRTGDILADYVASPGDVDVKAIVEPDNGQTEAINRGFSLASGDVICWLNTDEWYLDGTLDRISRFLAERPDVDVVFGDCDFYDAEGTLVKRRKEHFYSAPMLLYYGCYIPSCSTFLRKRLFDAGHHLDPSYKVTMDFEWYVRLAAAGYRICHLPGPLASFTWHDSNISSTLVERRLAERRRILETYSGLKGPAWLKTLFFETFRAFWKGVRVARRSVPRLS